MVKVEIEEKSVQALLSAMRANQVFAHKSQKSALLYAVQKVLYHLRAATKKSKPHASSKQLEKVPAKKVLEVFPFIQQRNINMGREYWLAHSDRKKDNGALIKGWYKSTQKHTKAEAAKMLKHRNAGLAKLTWLAGMKKAKVNAAGESESGANTMSIATKNITFNLTENAERWQASIRNNLDYATDALTSPNAVNNAVMIAANQMKQILRHKLKEQLEKK